MNITFKVTTKPKSENYMRLFFNGDEYNIRAFYEKFYNIDDEFKVDRMLKDCDILYKDNPKISYNDLCKRNYDSGEFLQILNIFFRDLYPNLSNIFITDRDYYAAAKMIKSLEEQHSFARLSLLEASQIIDFNINLCWATGYVPIYKIRTIKANNAILCYNNVFDYIMQVIFIGFEIYKNHPDYSENLEFEKILKLCDYSYLSKYYSENKAIKNFKELWKILSKAQNINQNVNKWANYIKHKGGIKYMGVEADEPFSMIIKTKDGIEITDKDFEPLCIDLDDVLEELQKVNNELVRTIEELVNFMNYNALIVESSEKKRIIPYKDKYKKVMF